VAVVAAIDGFDGQWGWSWMRHSGGFEVASTWHHRRLWLVRGQKLGIQLPLGRVYLLAQGQYNAPTRSMICVEQWGRGMVLNITAPCPMASLLVGCCFGCAGTGQTAGAKMPGVMKRTYVCGKSEFYMRILIESAISMGLLWMSGPCVPSKLKGLRERGASAKMYDAMSALY
jgi:hypothetical protein